MKKTVCIIVACFLFGLLILPVTAFGLSEDYVRELLVDDAEIIPDSQESGIIKALNEYSNEYSMDIVIVTAKDIGAKTYEEYADDYFDYNGYGQGVSKNGILLLISMNPRGVAVSTSGKCMKYFSNEKCDEIIDTIYNYLKDEDYDLASVRFTNEVGLEMKSIKARPVYLIFVSLGVGFIISSILVSSMKSKLKMVAMKQNAAGYEVPGSFRLLQNEDRFLYNNISRTKIERNNSGGSGGSHTSSSGNSHGGASRSF